MTALVSHFLTFDQSWCAQLISRLTSSVKANFSTRSYIKSSTAIMADLENWSDISNSAVSFPSTPSLADIAGVTMAKEARLFLQELEVGLTSISSTGARVDEQWCTHDWNRFILGILTDSMKSGTGPPTRDWNYITESWHALVFATVDLVISYTLPQTQIQRFIVREGEKYLYFQEMIQHHKYDPTLTKDDRALLASIFDSPEKEHTWNKPLVHYKPFIKWVQEARSLIYKSYSRKQLRSQQIRGIEASELREFNIDFEEDLRRLIAHLTPGEHKNFSSTLERAFMTALHENNVDEDLRYLRFCRSLIEKWSPIDAAFQSKVNLEF